MYNGGIFSLLFSISGLWIASAGHVRVDVGLVKFWMAFRFNRVDDWVRNMPLSKISLSDRLDPYLVSRSLGYLRLACLTPVHYILVACSVCCGLGGSSLDINIS